MAKKKSSKTASKKSESYSAELWGVLFILVGVMGIGSFGPVGNIIKGFSIFLMGTWNVVVLALFILAGTYMFIKRKRPNLFSIKLTGFYLILLALLVNSHMQYAIEENLNGQAIIQATIDNFLDSGLNYTFNSGGGIIGGLFTIFFTKMFDFDGTKIVIVVLAVVGVLLAFNINLAQIVKFFRNVWEKIRIPEYDDDEDDEDDEITEDGRHKKKLLKEKKENARSIEDTICTESLENVKVFSSAVAQPHPEEQMQMPLNEPVTVKVEEENIEEENKPYQLPTLDILDKLKPQSKVNTTEFLQTNKANLERVLKDFQISGRVVEIHEGPAITQFEVKIDAGTRVSRITSIDKEIALALSAKEVRIEAPIPGKDTIGIEIPNMKIASVPIREVLSRPNKESMSAKIPVALGKDITGAIKWMDLAKTPHLLVAGATGSGKSVCINSMIASILMTRKPNEVKLAMVDPKKVELSNYNGIPHLLWPVVTDPKKASAMLQKVVARMEERYQLFEEKGVKNISGYNDWVDEQNKKAGTEIEKRMYYLVVIIDELADLMVVAKKDVEDSIMRITQMARAAGIHLIVATQRPSTNVITGVIKANIPSRIAFTVASYVDSMTIMGSSGAEKLLGKGDMLYLPMGENTPTRVQGNFISDGEVERLIRYVSKEQAAHYDRGLEEDTHMAGANSPTEEYDDPLYNDIVEFAMQTGKISASLLQRRFKIGYNRAARVVDLLEERGIIGPANGSKPREVIVGRQNQ